MGYDRNEVLERTDLGELADQLVAPHKGRGTGATWPCPDSGHGEQTGKTPPVSIFRTTYGDERWRCHSCGAGGTAIDLVMTTQGVRFPEAIELLARRAGVAEVDRPMPALRTAQLQRPVPIPEGRPNPEVERFVASTEAYLWSNQGQPMQRWLAERGLGEAVLRANRIGADPGPAGLDRGRGLPRGGPAVVLPVLGPDGAATYLQSRYLNPNGHKYDNPSAAMAGTLPRTAEVRLPRPAADPGLVVVSEGIPDALVAAQAGYRAVAVLGAAVPDERTAAAPVERFPNERLVLALDADGPGQAGAERLGELLAERGAGDRVVRLDVPATVGDLNAWQLATGRSFGQQFAQAIARTTEASMAIDRQEPEATVPAPRRNAPVEPRPRPAHLNEGNTHDLTINVVSTTGDGAYVAAAGANRPSSALVATPAGASRSEPPQEVGASVGALDAATGLQRAEQAQPELQDQLETIRYHHLLVDDPALAAANSARIDQAVAAWTKEDLAHVDRGAEHAVPYAVAALSSPTAGMAKLDRRLEDLAYRHLLVDDPQLARLKVDMATSVVREWSSVPDRTRESDLSRSGADPDLAAAQRWAFDHGLSARADVEAPEAELNASVVDG